MAWSATAAVLVCSFLLVLDVYADRQYHLKLDFSIPLGIHYEGLVRINFTQTDDTTSLLLYALKSHVRLKESEIRLEEINLVPISIKSIVWVDDNSFTMNLASPLRKNYNYSLEIPFKARFLEDGVVLARDMIYSNFHDGDASSAFPCFNDPGKFNLALTHSKDWDSYSLTKGNRMEYNDNVVTTFKSDKIIFPSSLSFVVVSGFEEYQKDKTNIIFLTRKGNTASVYLETCADMSLYPFYDMMMSEEKEKVYLVPIDTLPNDYSSNLNMIYIKSSLMKYDPESTTDDNAELCLMILKLIGQQFYGIRLPKKEKFYTEAAPYFLAIQAFKEMKTFWGQGFIAEKTTELFDMGFINTPIKDDEIGLKGAAFLGMLDDFTHANESMKLVDVMVSYYKSPESSQKEDFYTFLDEKWKISSHLSKDDWTNWMNSNEIPILEVEDNDPTNYKIKCLNPAQPALSFPVIYEDESGNKPTSTVIKCDTTDKTIPKGKEKGIFLNPSGTGLYRVQYSKSLLAQLKSYTANNASLQGRSRVLSDSLEFACQESQDKDDDLYKEVLMVTNYLTNEYECTPWKIAMKKFNVLRNLFYAKTDSDFRNRLGDMLNYYTNDLGMKQSNNFISNMCRKTILQANVMFGVKQTSQNLFDAYYNVYLNNTKPESLGGDILHAAKCAFLAQKGGDPYYWQKFDEDYHSQDNAIKKRRLFEQYSCSIGPKKVFDKILDMIEGDRKSAFDYATLKAENIGPFLKIMSSEVDTMVKNDKQTLEDMLQVIGPRINNKDKGTQDYLEKIKAKYPVKSVDDAIADSEAIEKFTNNHLKGLQNWFGTPLDPHRKAPTTTSGPTPPTQPDTSTEPITPTPGSSTGGTGTESSSTSTTTKAPGAAASAGLSAAAALAAALAALANRRRL